MHQSGRFWCEPKELVGHDRSASENLLLRSHDADELAHYAKDGCGTFDVEYRFPFTAPGYGELEGVAHHSNFDLSQHAQHAGAKLEYFDQERTNGISPTSSSPQPACPGAFWRSCARPTPKTLIVHQAST